MIHADTSFLVDLLRESRRGKAGPATALLASLAGEEVRVGLHALCELLVGAEGARQPAVERQRVRRLCQGLVVSYPDNRLPPVYARLVKVLNGSGRSIGTMDVLIAAAALVDGATVLTRNVRHFDRVPGLAVRSY
ncbi:type II toxin-antitoxin system VapC family toxin [bacterium]|nr:type II toxin-antitoxin system VapC family toxin [bacterium]